MRIVPILFAAASILSSCTTIVIGDAHVWGRTKDVSVADIRAALAIAAADRYSHGKTPEAQVISRDEIHVFFERGGGNAVVVKRIRGRWQPGGYVIVTS